MDVRSCMFLMKFRYTELEIIHLQYNKIRKLDGIFARLKKLQDLRLDANQLKYALPTDFEFCKKLSVLDLSNNSLTSIEVTHSLLSSHFSF